jgi:hypothetical protein
MQSSCNPHGDSSGLSMQEPPNPTRIATIPGASRFSLSFDYLWPRSVTLTRPLLVIAFASFILCSFSASQPSISPETGTMIKDVARNGYGVLTIHNNWTMDTVGVLTDDNLKPLMAVYIRSKNSFKFEKIDDGSYGLYFTVGNNWDANEKKFRDVLGYYRYHPSLVFQTTENDSDIEYSVFELDLYEAGSSNFVPDVFDFPDLR